MFPAICILCGIMSNFMRLIPPSGMIAEAVSFFTATNCFIPVRIVTCDLELRAISTFQGSAMFRPSCFLLLAQLSHQVCMF